MNEEVRAWLLNRDSSIFEEHLNGVSNVEIARKFNLSAQRVCQIIGREKDRLDRPAKDIVLKDKSVSLFGTWAQKVSLLMPHLQAIKAIAEEKNT
jgi:orotate phosphoribosyltransferase-like protein